MMYNIELNEYELNTLRSLVMAEYNRDKIRFENRFTDDVDKDIISDSMGRLKVISGKLDNAIVVVK